MLVTADTAAQRIADFFENNDQSLDSLDLSNLDLQQFPPCLQQYMLKYPTIAARIKLINLANNNLCTLPNFLQQLPNLEILFLLRNSFTTIPDVIQHLPSLYMLSFKENRLTGTIRASMLPINISWLILTSNQITSLSDDFAAKCSKVRKLMLSNNALSHLPISFGQQMRSLELLRLSNNRLQTFPHLLFQLPNLKWLSLAGNPCTGGIIKNAASLPSESRIHCLDEQYDIQWQRALGCGASGAAYPGVERVTRQKVAVKKFQSAAGSDGRSLDEVSVTLAARGVTGVVQALGYSVDINGDFMLVTELVDGNARVLAAAPSFVSCTRSVYTRDRRFDEPEARRICDAVQDAVGGLLDRGIAHGDVYAHNILVGDRATDGSLPVVLADFGAAWRVGQEEMEGVRAIEMRALAVFQKEIWDRVG